MRKDRVRQCLAVIDILDRDIRYTGFSGGVKAPKPAAAAGGVSAKINASKRFREAIDPPH